MVNQKQSFKLCFEMAIYTSSLKFGNGKCNEIFKIPDF